MPRIHRPLLGLSLLIAGLGPMSFAQTKAHELPICSTEKVNHTDCRLVINRLYPVIFPTIQMAHGKKIFVRLENPLTFETVTLDQTSANLYPGSDQVASLVPQVLSNFKGLTFSSAVISGAKPVSASNAKQMLALPSRDAQQAQVKDELQTLQSLLETTTNTITNLYREVSVVYAQLSQVLAPLPRPAMDPSSGWPPPPLVDSDTPNPWALGQFPAWRSYLLCELVGGYDCPTDPRPEVKKPSFTNILQQLAAIEAELPATPAPAQPLFDQHGFDVLAQQAKNHILNLPAGTQQPYLDALNLFFSQENQLVSAISALGTNLPNVQKDFQTYYQNIELIDSTPTPDALGAITDPSTSTASYPGFLGRQVVYSVNVVNQIATSLASVVTASAKTSISSITVIYADPRLESSAGVLFNFVHSRSFANQTITTPAPGTSQVAGEVDIFETETRPSYVPFVAADIRLFNDFTLPISHRRGAFYATAWVGLNANNTLPEYGAGPTFAWRSVMFSALYDRTHDTRLTPGTYVGQVVCLPAPPAGSSVPSCSSAPAAPTTVTFGTNSFAFGISVRIPTSFAAGTGGVSR